ncbi:MAG: YeeE/YedE family protein [Nitrospirae bacterium]|nr:YeeE/YedE family protein [Nitrospirota bacterium]MBF0542642.1 YeeE/YedE family protein [Nitrospirota bacterium]
MERKTNFLTRKRGWPIHVGIAFAVVELLSFIISDRPLGASRGYTVIGAIFEKVFFPEHAENVKYWILYEPVIDWTVALLLGLITGSFISAVSSGSFKIVAVPDMWKQSVSTSIFRRWFWALIGGIIFGFGARMAGGCISGLMISGSVQLAPAGFIAMMTVWMGGVLTTIAFYRLRTIAMRKD